MPDVTSPQTAPQTVKPNLITWSPAAAIGVTIFAYFFSQVFGSLVIIGAAILLKHDDWGHWTEQVVPQFFYILLIESLTLGIVWLFLNRRKASFKLLGLTKPKWRDLGYAFIGFFTYFPLLIAAMGLFKYLFPKVNTEQAQQIGFQGAHGTALVVVFIGLVVLPPLTEEILMRGFLFTGLKSKLPVITAAIVTSILFAAAHLQPGSGAPLLWAAAVDTFVLSMVLVWLRQKTGRLWASIALHMLKNGIAFLSLFIFKA